MAKAGIKAMGATTAFVANKTKQTIGRWVTAGASKRGATMWLTGDHGAAADKFTTIVPPGATSTMLPAPSPADPRRPRAPIPQNESSTPVDLALNKANNEKLNAFWKGKRNTPEMEAVYDQLLKGGRAPGRIMVGEVRQKEWVKPAAAGAPQPPAGGQGAEPEKR